jgi:hyperosmotically inducible protein
VKKVGTSLAFVVLPVAVLFLASSLPPTASIRAQDPLQPAADNTKTNKDQAPPTADQQKMNPSDRAITQKILKAIDEDKSLSTYAHNIKLTTQYGKVTLRGPVRSHDEKSNLEARAATVAGQENVTNQLEIAHSK